MQQGSIEQLQAQLKTLNRALESPDVTQAEADDYRRQIEATQQQIARLNAKPPAAKPGKYTLSILVGVVLFILALFIIHSVNENPSGPKTRKEQVDNVFRGTGGSCPELVAYVKGQMNDPESFQHAETRYIDKGDYLQVFMKYRGKNAFGGTVTETVSAHVSLSGGVSRVEKSE